MIKFYFNAAPNPMKVALFLEEAGLPYEAIPVDGRAGDQHKPAYKAINPNAKAPSIVDDGVAVFDSNAILLYLAEKTGKFLPPEAQRGQLLSWLMFVASGIGPYSGQAVHFRHAAPGEKGYAFKRYDFEAHRHWGIVDERLGQGQWMLGDDYSIVDMAVWGWARMLPHITGDKDALEKYSNIARLLSEIGARPAAERALALPGKHTFKTEMDDNAKRAMFPSMFAADPA